ncbi:hypothetical protein D3C80_1178340 [compost metagenome]
MITIGRISHLSARSFDPLADHRAEINEMAKGVCGDIVKILQNELSHVTVEQRLRRHVAGASSLVDSIGDDQEYLRLRNAPSHCVGEENIAASANHSVENGHDF